MRSAIASAAGTSAAADSSRASISGKPPPHATASGTSSSVTAIAPASSRSRATVIRAGGASVNASVSAPATCSSSQRLTVRAPNRGSNACATARSRTARPA